MLMYDESSGSFKVSCGQIRVSDPCYEKDSDSGLTVDNVLNGQWFAYFDYAQTANYVARFFAVHSDYYRDASVYDLKEIGCVGVDSGQLSMFDKVYYDENQGGEYGELDTFYGKCCKITEDKDCGVLDNVGVVSSSGYGDGSYTVCVCLNNEGCVTCVYVEFICNEDEEEEA